MFKSTASFSSFSAKDLAEAKTFYAETLGVGVDSDEMGLKLQLPGGGTVFVYEKEDHQPATFTVLNFVVADIDEAVDDLAGKGVQFERYEGMGQDEKGIVRPPEGSDRGPQIAWLKDPAGNILSVLQDTK